jgi:hypothetical protein
MPSGASRISRRPASTLDVFGWLNRAEEMPQTEQLPGRHPFLACWPASSTSVSGTQVIPPAYMSARTALCESRRCIVRHR